MSEENEALTLDTLRQIAEEHDGAEPDYVAPLPDMNKPYIKASDQTETPTPESTPAPEAEKPEPEAESKEESKDEPKEEAGPPDVDESSLKNREAADVRLEKTEKRLNETWRKVNDQKEANAREKAELEELRNSLNDRAKPEAYVDSDGNSAEDYEAAARNFELEGQFGLAESARKQAESVRGQAEEMRTERNDTAFKEEWGKNFDEAARSYPELRDSDSQFRRAVNGLLEERPVLAKYPGGILDAADIIAMQVRAGESDQLREQITALSEENGGLKSKLSIGGSDPSSVPSGSKSFGDMTPQEQFVELQRRAEAVDAGTSY